MVASNTYGRQVVVPLVNKSGGSVAAGDVVIVDTTNDGAFTTTTSGAFTGGIGVAQETIASNATGRVLTAGYAALVNVNASVTRGQYGKTHTVVKQATGTSVRGVGTFCQWLTGGTTPTAYVYSPDLNASAGNVATDAIWDAAGDLAVGTGADTAARLAAGNAGGVLAMGNSAVFWNAGTSFPASKATNDRYWRTDLGMEFYWDGTRWVSTFVVNIPIIGVGFDEAAGLAAVTYLGLGPVPYKGTLGLWLVSWEILSFVAGTNDGTKYWTQTLYWYNAATTRTSLGAVNTSADTVNNMVYKTLAIGAVLNSTATAFEILAGKTSTPGALNFTSSVIARLIAT